MERTPAASALAMLAGLVGVGHDDLAHRLRLVDGGGHLLHRELGRDQGVGGGHGAAGGHDLDLGGAAAELLAGGFAHLVGAVADGGERRQAGDRLVQVVLVAQAPVAVAAGLGDHRPAGQDARPADVALDHRLSEAAVDAAGVADGGEAGLQRVFDDLLHFHRPYRQRLGSEGFRAQVGNAQVDMGVGEAGHDGAAAEVQDTGVAGDAQPAPRMQDTGALHQNRGPWNRVGAGAVDEQAVAQGDGLGHGVQGWIPASSRPASSTLATRASSCTSV
jgi:hypothetical protein